MSRPYNDTFLRKLAEGEITGLGSDLARLCIKAHIPAKYVAIALEVTPLTVFKWYRGARVQDQRHAQIEVFMKLVNEDMIVGTLPARNSEAAKIYIQQMLGREI